MTKHLLITSFKGGVGKTTFAASLGAALASLGKSVVVCDCDLESRCLDLVACMDEVPLYHICDLLRQKCPLEDAVREDGRVDGLAYITAPPVFPDDEYREGGRFTAGQTDALIEKLDEKYEYVIFDLPARPDALFEQLVRRTDIFLVLSLHTAASVRAAETTANAIRDALGETGENADIRLVVNGFKAKDTKNRDNAGLYDILSRTHLPLAGVIPFDAVMVAEQEKGHPAFLAKDGKTDYYKAIVNTAGRLEGRNIRLLHGIRTGCRSAELL